VKEPFNIIYIGVEVG